MPNLPSPRRGGIEGGGLAKQDNSALAGTKTLTKGSVS